MRRSISVARQAGTLRVAPYFGALLSIFAILYLVVFWPGQPRTPKLGLDLQGGAQAILQAKTEGGKAPTKAALEQARTIITNRVNARGVSSAEVVTQGSDRIVVSIPGKGIEALKDVGDTALLQFRPYVTSPIPVAAPQPTATGSSTASATPSATSSLKATTTPSSSESPKSGIVRPLGAPAAGPTPSATKSSASTTPSATPSASPSASTAVDPDAPIDQWADLGFAPPNNSAEYAKLTQAQQAKLQGLMEAWDCSRKPLDVPTKPIITCDVANTTRFLLGSVIVKGTEISTAAAIPPGSQQGQFAWSISVELKPSGQTAWANYTSQHNEQKVPGDIANTVAFTLDSKVKSPSTIQETINGATSISGSFTQKSAEDLATSLKYGALPLTFTTQDSRTVSASLGLDQMRAGLLAGGIGLLLVVVYSLIYYRALGLVTIASLAVSGGITYALLVILGKQISFTLTLAGIAGFIVAVGITADSFVVFFERIKDEVHEGRSARVAVPRAWERAKRTIITADVVSLLAAGVLYFFAAGDVRGFAFTLGMSTAIDLLVVFLFTHPLVSVFSRSAAFGSARFTGLDHVRNANYVPMEPAMAGAEASSGSGSAVSGSAAARAAARRGLTRDTDATTEGSDNA
jgi:preprotein translocase subunit SecD